MQNRPSENQSRISELAKQIDELSTELAALLIIEQADQGRDIADIRREIQIGDIVEITNAYRDQQGKQGTVVKITSKQVSIQLLESGRIVKKKKSNVKIIPSSDENTEQ
jgi:hypothetical protein